MVEAKAIYTIWLRELIRFRRSKSRIVGTLMTPLIFLVLLGTGLSSVISIGGSGNYMGFLSPGIIGMSLLFTSIFSGVSVIYDRQFGFLKEILVAPVSRTSIALGKILGSATVSAITALMILVISVVFGFLPLASLTIAGIALTLVFIALIAMTFVSLGLIIASSLNDTEGFQLIMNFIVMPLFILSGAFFPVTNLPAWLKIPVMLNPLFYGVEGMRYALLGTSSVNGWTCLAVLFVVCVVMVFLSSRSFNKMQK